MPDAEDMLEGVCGMASEFDVFLSYYGPDRASAERLGRQLEARGLEVWLDVWCLRPGLPWRRALEEQIDHVCLTSSTFVR